VAGRLENLKGVGYWEYPAIRTLLHLDNNLFVSERVIKGYAITYGNPEEKEIIKSSLGYIEEEIQGGDEDGTKETFLFLILLATVLKKSRLKARKPPGEQ